MKVNLQDVMDALDMTTGEESYWYDADDDWQPEPQPVIEIPVPPVEVEDDEPLPPVLTWEDIPQTGDVDFGFFFAALALIGVVGLVKNRRRA